VNLLNSWEVQRRKLETIKAVLAVAKFQFVLARNGQTKLAAQSLRVGAWARMRWKRKVQGSLLGFIGFMLSPLSWWNDAFVNLPLAIGFAWVVALFYKPAFTLSLVVGYWLTNVLGFVLMHKGAQKFLSPEERRYTGRDMARDLAISLLYTLLIVALVKCKVLQPIENYFAEK